MASSPTSAPAVSSSVLSIPNVRWFVLQNIFFNARFYYPVFTILFLDFGLTMAQFALLNAIWAATIVVMEVPSGALADVIGRRKLLVASGVLMVLEVGLLAFAPRNRPHLTFGLFLLNRVLSGTAEAMASGADQAIAYDSLKAAGRETEWPRVLEIQMRWQSVAFVAAMSLGAALYDPQLMQAVADFLGIDYRFSQGVTLRIPLVMTFIMALVTLGIVLQFREEENGKAASSGKEPSAIRFQDLKQALGLTLRAGAWIWGHGFARAVIIGGLLFDSMARMVITLASQYYRMIQIPEAVFGVIGSVLALMGIFTPRVARWMADRFAPRTNVLITGTVIGAGLAGMVLFLPYWGLVPALLVFGSMSFNGFFVSHYLNQVTDSSQRATVLSFKGLFFNLAYGLCGLAYSMILSASRTSLEGGPAPAGNMTIEDLLFVKTFLVFPLGFLLGLVLLALIIRRALKNRPV